MTDFNAVGGACVRGIGALCKFMHLVDDQVRERRVVRRPPQQQIVVHDDDLGALEATACFSKHACPGGLFACVTTAFGGVSARGLAAAAFEVRVELVEHAWNAVDLSMAGAPCKGGDQSQRERIRARQERSRLIEKVVEPRTTQIVRATFHQGIAQIAVAGQPGGGGNVFFDELPLQELAGSRDDDLGAGFAGKRNGDGEVGEGFPNTGSRLADADRLAVLAAEAVEHVLEEPALLGPVAIAWDDSFAERDLLEALGDRLEVERYGVGGLPGRMPLRFDTIPLYATARRMAKTLEPGGRGVEPFQRTAGIGCCGAASAGLGEYLDRHTQRIEGVVESAVPFAATELVAAERVELHVAGVRVDECQQLDGVEKRVILESPLDRPRQPLAFERGIVGDHRDVADEPIEFDGDLGQRRRLIDVLLADSRKPANERRQNAVGSDERVEDLDLLSVRLNEGRAGLDQYVACWIEPGGFEIEETERPGRQQQPEKFDVEVERGGIDHRAKAARLAQRQVFLKHVRFGHPASSYTRSERGANRPPFAVARPCSAASRS